MPVESEPSPSILATQLSQENLWDQAVDFLPPKEKAFIQEHVTTSVSSYTDFQTILKAVQEKKRKCEEGRWKFTFNGHELVLRDLADRVCAWLDRFKQIGDIVANVDPLHAGLPWAGIRLLLQVRPFSIFSSFLFVNNTNLSSRFESSPRCVVHQIPWRISRYVIEL